jgi:hypothetical protein
MDVMKYTEMMDKIKQLELSFSISPDVGFIKVSLINDNKKALATSNIGWYSFRDNPIESLIAVFEQYEISQKLPSLNG